MRVSGYTRVLYQNRVVPRKLTFRPDIWMKGFIYIGVRKTIVGFWRESYV